VKKYHEELGRTKKNKKRS